MRPRDTLLTVTCMIGLSVSLPGQDFGDAPPPFPSVSHDTINEEWMAANSTGTTTSEQVALISDLDSDDADSIAGSILFHLPTDPFVGAAAVPVGIAIDAPAGSRFLNILVDFNKNNAFGDVFGALREHVVQDVPVNVVPGEFAWIIIRGFPIDLPAVPNVQVWIRATLTRSPVGIEDWKGDGNFGFGETEDLFSVIPPFPEWQQSVKDCVPAILEIQPDPVIVPLAPATAPFSISACDSGCCTRVDIRCQRSGGVGPSPIIDPLPSPPIGLPPDCKLPILPAPGVVASSPAKELLTCASIPIFAFGFKARYPGPADNRVFTCVAEPVTDPDDTAVIVHDVTDDAQSKNQFTLIEKSSEIPTLSIYGLVSFLVLLLVVGLFLIHTRIRFRD